MNYLIPFYESNSTFTTAKAIGSSMNRHALACYFSVIDDLVYQNGIRNYKNSLVFLLVLC